jgi:hypothetical protein
LLSDAANTQSISLSQPIVLMLNRAAVLGLGNQASIALDLNLTLSTQELSTSLTVDVSSLDLNETASEYITYADEILSVQS